MSKSEEQLKLRAQMPNPAIETWKSNGKKVVGTLCCHVPEEIIHAAGLLPIRVRGTGCTSDSEAEVWMSSFCCSYARACLQYVLNGTYSFLDGLVSSDGCQMAQRLVDNWKYLEKKTYKQLVLAPRVVSNAGLHFYREELDKLKEGMEKLSGVTITQERLKKSIEVYNETRRLIRELYSLRKNSSPVITGADSLTMTLAAMSMPKEEYNELLKGFLEEAKNKKPLTNVRARLMVIGSSLDDPEFLKIIEDKGGLVVTDVQCFGSRYLWEDVDNVGEDAMASLTESYLKRPVCPRMCKMHTEFSDLILDMAKDFNVGGIVFVKMKNCDMWGGESMFLQDKIESSGMPLLNLEREEIMTNAGQIAVRAEAFIEMIEGGK
jgi:bzd-type benzoyl-CoA reductase N subunit